MAYEIALDAALESWNRRAAVSVERACAAAGRSRTWATANEIGSRAALMEAVADREATRIIYEIHALGPITGRRQIRVLLRTLLGPPEGLGARLRVLRMRQEVLGAALGPLLFHPALGPAALGVLTSPLATTWAPTYQELLETSERWAGAVLLFEEAHRPRADP